MAANTTCPSCRLEMPRGELAYDGYFHCSSECWSVCTGVIGAEFENMVLFGQVHQLTVDAYAVQHAGGSHPDKSVDVHLVGLHLQLERGVRSPDVAPRLQSLVGGVATWPHFAPPARHGELTILDVALAGSPLEHAKRVRAWAQDVWNTWGPHHEAIDELATSVYAARGV